MQQNQLEVLRSVECLDTRDGAASAWQRQQLQCSSGGCGNAEDFLVDQPVCS